MIDLRRCPGCGGPGGRERFRSVDYLTGGEFPVVVCSACGLTRTVFVGDEDALDAHYPQAYYGNAGGSRFPGLMERAVEWFRRARLQSLKSLLPARGTALDIGCGRGLFLRELGRRGWRTLGTERSPGLADAARERGVTIVADPGEIASTSVDLLTLWHVLEHLPDPGQILAEALRILRPEGLLVIEVPNLGSLQARFGRDRWFHLDVPRHLVHFDANSLERMLTRVGFEPVGRGTFSMEYGPYGLAQTILNRVTRAPNVLFRTLQRAGDRSRMDASDLALTALATPPAFLAAFVAEPLAAVTGRGGVLRILARPREGQ